MLMSVTSENCFFGDVYYHDSKWIVGFRGILDILNLEM